MELDLKRNWITNIYVLAFLSRVSLIKSNLKDNLLLHIPATFRPKSHNMIRLLVTNNPCIITVAWLEQFRSLDTLNIEAIGIEGFPSNLFKGIINLKSLTIGSSKAPNLMERGLSLKKLFLTTTQGQFPEEKSEKTNRGSDAWWWPHDYFTTLPWCQSLGEVYPWVGNLEFVNWLIIPVPSHVIIDCTGHCLHSSHFHRASHIVDVSSHKSLLGVAFIPVPCWSWAVMIVSLCALCWFITYSHSGYGIFRRWRSIHVC